MSRTVKNNIQMVGESVMDIACIGNWHERLGALLAQDASPIVRFDMSAVEKIDTACLQLLVAFVLAAKKKKQKIEWHSRSERFLAAAHTLNLDEILSVPV